MTATEKKAKPIISKKWLYGSLVALALIWGVYTNTEAANNNGAPNSVEQVQIDNGNDDIDIVTDDDYASDDDIDNDNDNDNDNYNDDDDTDQEWGYDSLDDEE
ncbi:hypothetical protein ACTXGO_05350, partial [Psychrobacter sp. T6-1]|uniref:hypothetical protein n=1 Tax=Psychrobacter sp. T6-1 TaxID=3457447 RepID=UPI003FD269A7